MGAVRVEPTGPSGPVKKGPLCVSPVSPVPRASPPPTCF